MKKLIKKIWDLNEGDRVKFPKSYNNKYHYTKKDGTPYVDTTDKKVWVDRYPNFNLDVTSHKGIVSRVHKTPHELFIDIKLDKHYSDLDEWDNNVEFYGELENNLEQMEDYDMELIKENK